MANIGLRLGINLPSKSELQSQIDKLIKDTQGSEINLGLDTKAFTKSIADMSKELDKLKGQLSNFGVINVDTSSLSKARQEIKNISNEGKNLSSVKVTTDGVGNITKQVNTYIDSIGTATTETVKFGQVISSTTTDNIGKYETLISTLQRQMDGLSNNKLIDASVVQNLQNKLNSITMDTPKESVEEFKRSLNDLSSNETGIVRVKNAIEQLKNNFEKMNGKYGSLVGDADSISQLKAYESQLKNLESLITKMKSGTPIDGKVITSNINSANASFRTLQTSVQNSSSALKVANQDAMSFSESIVRTAEKFGLWVSIATVVNKLGQELRQASEYVLEMDKRLTNIQMITGNSASGVSQITNEFKELGAQLHTTNSEMMAGAEEVLRAGYDVETAKKMMEASLIGAKLSGQTTATVTEQLIAIKNSFSMSGDEMNGVIDVLSKLDNTSATSFAEISEAIQRTAFSAQQAGTSFEDLSVYITTVSEKTRRSADVIGESFKSIYSRYSNIKLGSLDDDGKSINDVETALGRVGIKIRDVNGDFRDFDDVLKEFAKKSKTLSQTDFLAGVNALAGSRQKESLLALIENFDQVEKHQQDIADSTGNAKRMFDETYSNSLDAKVQDLKRSMESLYDTLLSSETLGSGTTFLTGVISGIDTVISKFGLLPTLIVTVGTLMLSTSKSFGGFITKVQSMITLMADGTTTLGNEMSRSFNIVRDQSTGAITKVSALGMSFDVVKIKALAMQTAVSLGLSLLVAGVVTLITKLANAKEELRNFNESYASSNNSDGSSKVTSAEKLVESYKKLSNELSSLQKDTDAYKSKEQELADVQSQIIGLYPDANNLIKENADNKLLNIDATDKLIAKERELAEAKANEVLSKNKINDGDDIDSLLSKYSKAQEQLKALNEAKANGENLTTINGNRVTVTQGLSSTVKDVEEYESALKALLPAVQLLEQSNPRLVGTYQSIADALGISTQAAKDNTQALQENSSVGDSNGDVVSDEQSTVADRLNKNLESIGLTISENKKITDDFNEALKNGKTESEALNSAYGDVMSTAISNMDKIKNLQDAINKKGVGDSDVIKTIASDYPQLLSKMSDRKALQEELNTLMDDEKSKYSQAYAEIMADDAAWYQQKIATNQALQTSINNFCSYFKDAHGNAYQVDLSNYKTLTEMKNALTQGMSQPLAQWLANVVGGQASAYEKDLQNFKSLGEAKAYVIAKVDEQITKLESRMAESLRNSAEAIKALNMGSSSSDAEAAQIESDYLRLQARLEAAISKLQASKADIDKSFNEIGASFDTAAPSISGIGSGGSGGSGSGGSGSDSSKDEYKAQIDRFRQQQLELDKINKLLELNNILSQNANSKDKVRLAQERIELLKKQKQALENLNSEQQKSLNETKSAIQNYGGIFDSSGNLTNYQQILSKYTGDSAKAVEELIKKYDDLNDKIADTSNQIEDVKNSTIDAYKTIGDELKEQWKKETDTLKSEIQKRKDALSKDRADEDFEDSKFEAQKKLSDLQQRKTEALRSGNMSMANQLDEEIRQAQKELNDLIRDKELDNSNNRFDEELNKLDEQLDKKVETMEKEIQNGNLMKYIQDNGINLATIFDDINSMSRGVNSNMMMVGSSIDTWNDSLNAFKNNLASIQSSLSLSLNSNSLVSGQQGKSVTIQAPITIEINGDGSAIDENMMRSIMRDVEDNILNQVNYAFR